MATPTDRDPEALWSTATGLRYLAKELSPGQRRSNLLRLAATYQQSAATLQRLSNQTSDQHATPAHSTVPPQHPLTEQHSPTAPPQHPLSDPNAPTAPPQHPILDQYSSAASPNEAFNDKSMGHSWALLPAPSARYGR